MVTSGRIAWTEEKRKLGDLLAWPNNPRQIDRKQAKRLVESFDEFGQVETMAIGPANELYNGHQRLNVLMEQYGPAYEVDVRVASRALTEREREKLTIYLHKGAAGTWDFDILADRFEQDDLLAWGFEPFELGLGDDLQPEASEGEAQTAEQARATLAERFLVPPFSVLDARQGYWQARKSAWIALGIQSELGRGEDIVPNGSERPPEQDGAWMRHTRNNSPGGSPRPAASLVNGRTVRGDGAGKPLKRGGVSMAMHNDPMQRKARYDQG
jgi:hypothetical protein